MSAAFHALTGLELLAPWRLALVLLVVLALVLRRRTPRAALAFPPARFLDADARDPHDTPAPRPVRVRLVALPLALETCALVCLVVALAEPVRRTPDPRRAEGIDVVLVLDVSSSMTARDLDRTRTRLDVARDAAAQFVAGRPDDRIGLVTFARFADVVAPPTLDHGALLALLDGVTPVRADGPEDATGLGTALARTAALPAPDDTARARVAVLLTDGAENVALPGARDEIAPLHAAQLCAERGLRVHTVAIGGGDASAPATDPRQLAALAAATGGRAFAARDAGALAGVYAAIDTLEKRAAPEQRFLLEERFEPFALAALGLLALAGLAHVALGVALP